MHSRRRRPQQRPRVARTGQRARPRHAAPRQSFPARLLARALIGVLVPLLGATWLVSSSDVTLTVDGRPHQLTTYARTVDELLDRAGVEYTQQDEVVPAPATPVQDGMVVEVVHAREITLLIGGEENTVLVTALSVDEVLNSLAARQGLTHRSVVRPSRLTPVTAGMTVEVLNPVAVTVVADGHARDVVTDALTVDGVLRRLDVNLGPHDRVTPGLNAPVEAQMRITVERVQVRRQTSTATVDFATVERRSDDLDAGESREVQAGVNGEREVTERVLLVNGEEVSREVLSSRTITQPQTRIVEVGTGASPTNSEPDAAGVSDRSAPASEPEDEPEPAPQPAESSNSNTQSGEASYYHHPEEGMTAAHRTLPFGTVVTVTNVANGQSVQVTINDRGPYIDGRIIDLNEPAFKEIASIDSGVIDVRISW